MLIRYGAKMTLYTSTSFTSSVFHPQCPIIFLSRSNGSLWFPQSHKSHCFGSTLKFFYSFWFCWSFDFRLVPLFYQSPQNKCFEFFTWDYKMRAACITSLSIFTLFHNDLICLSLTFWTVFVVKYKCFCVTCHEFHHILFDLVLVQYIARITCSSFFLRLRATICHFP